MCGAGRMGSQIAAEYALGGHDVMVLARDAERARAALDTALDTAARHELADAAALAAAGARLRVTIDPASLSSDTALIVESIAEQLEAKAALVAPLAAQLPDATIATNTSSLSIDAIGAAVGAPERTIGTHYLNPPLLMPPVEVVRGSASDPARVAAAADVLRALGKRPVVVERDLPGFVWNRLQFALLREAMWLVESNVVSAEEIDTVLRDGLARRWTATGPFETAALGGGSTFATVAANLLPELSDAQAAPGLADLAPPPDASERIEQRDRLLARALRDERDER